MAVGTEPISQNLEQCVHEVISQDILPPMVGGGLRGWLAPLTALRRMETPLLCVTVCQLSSLEVCMSQMTIWLDLYISDLDHTGCTCIFVHTNKTPTIPLTSL